jgi:hypothetical protein
LSAYLNTRKSNEVSSFATFDENLERVINPHQDEQIDMKGDIAGKTYQRINAGGNFCFQLMLAC